jgi:hypothetical protein
MRRTRHSEKMDCFLTNKADQVYESKRHYKLLMTNKAKNKAENEPKMR